MRVRCLDQQDDLVDIMISMLQDGRRIEVVWHGVIPQESSGSVGYSNWKPHSLIYFA